MGKPMTSMKERAGIVLKIVAKAAGTGIKSFVLAILALGALTGVLLAGSIAITRTAGVWAMVSAALLAIASGGVACWIVATKRGIAGALSAAVRHGELGLHCLELIFDRLLKVDAAEELGERGRRPAEVAERLPLRKVEARLTAAVDRSLAERASQTGVRAWMAKKLRNTSLRLVQGLTLEEFRNEDARHGGVDLVQVRDKLGPKIDKKISAMILNASRKVTRLAVVALLLVSLGGAWGIRVLFLN
jgi:hypothetical protein